MVYQSHAKVRFNVEVEGDDKRHLRDVDFRVIFP